MTKAIKRIRRDSSQVHNEVSMDLAEWLATIAPDELAFGLANGLALRLAPLFV
jgi:uncharacterized membrane protein